MADVLYNPVAGVPFQGTLLMKDMTGTGGPYAPISLSVAGYVPLLSISAQSSIQSGVVMDNQGVRNNHSLVITQSAGIGSGGVVQLWGSQDGVNFFGILNNAAAPAIVALTTTAVAGLSQIGTAILSPIRYLQARITTTIPSGTITAYVASAG
jgi:hypothetical protein